MGRGTTLCYQFSVFATLVGIAPLGPSGLFRNQQFATKTCPVVHALTTPNSGRLPPVDIASRPNNEPRPRFTH